MNGWQGGDSFKMRPDQIQILNPVMILLFLPLFSKVIYPLFEKCGIRMTALRRMSAGQFITALAFVVSGFLQYSIEDGLTPIPNYGNENSMMVINGVYGEDVTVESEYWATVDTSRIDDIEEGENVQTKFYLSGKETWRTETFAWINADLPTNMPVEIGDETVVLNGKSGIKVPVEKETIKSIVRIKKDVPEGSGDSNGDNIGGFQKQTEYLMVSVILIFCFFFNYKS